MGHGVKVVVLPVVVLAAFGAAADDALVRFNLVDGSAEGLSPPRWARDENTTTPTPVVDGSCASASVLEYPQFLTPETRHVPDSIGQDAFLKVK